MVLGARSVQIDFMVVYPLSASRIARGPARTQMELGWSEYFEGRKRAKHGAGVERYGDEFVPFVLESTGGFGEAAREFLKELAAFGAEALPHLKKKDIYTCMCQEITRAVVNGTWRKVSEVMQRSKAAQEGPADQAA